MSGDLSVPLTRAVIALAAIVFALGVAGLRQSAAPLRRMQDAAGLTLTALALVTWWLRWQHAGHLPIFGSYESALSLAACVLVATALLRRRLASPLVWAVGAAVAAGLTLHGLGFSLEAWPLTISERSLWLDLHALLAWAAFAALAANLAASLATLAGSAESAAARLLPPTLSVGFLLLSAMIASGSFYSFLLFGTTWSFDPIETMAVVVWLAYGTLLHLQLLAGWRGRRLARWSLLLFVLLVLSYRGITSFPARSTYHIFDMDLREHVVEPVR